MSNKSQDTEKTRRKTLFLFFVDVLAINSGFETLGSAGDQCKMSHIS
jgi:hypothetical protein